MSRRRPPRTQPAPPANPTASRIRNALETIRRDYDDTLEPVRRGQESHALSSLVNPPLPIPAGVLDIRAKAHERLAWWALQVIRGRHLHRLVAVDVHALTAFLLVHVDWLSAYPRALADLESSADKLGEIAAQNAPRHQDVGPCPGTTNGKPCMGMVTATVYRDDDLLPSNLTCSGTPSHSWPSGEWKTLSRRLHSDAAEARRLTARRGTDMVAGALRDLVDAIYCESRP